MIFDKSLKLLNYAKNTGGFLQLYTELDHSFVAGDKIFIIGGIYDNTQDLSYMSIYSTFTPTLYNPFNSNKSGYTIKSVDYSTNSFVIDYDITILQAGLLIYPYGITLNPFGNPQYIVNLAYNTFSSDDLYKGIYVSKTCFKTGRFRKGTINNGVFGNDYNLIRLNIHENQTAIQSDILINHIAAKNIKINSGLIKSKTDSFNPLTVKQKVNENTLLGNDLNPGALVNVTVTNNNDTWGYSSYERLSAKDVDIDNGEFSNPRANFIAIDNYTTTKAKLGCTAPIETNSLLLTNGTLNNIELNNYTINVLEAITLNTGIIDTFTDLNVISATISVNPGEIVFNVDYDVLANKHWVNGTICYISGIKPLLPFSDDVIFNSCFSFGSIQSVSYTYGDVTSAQITVLIYNFTTALYIGQESLFDFSAVKLSMSTHNYLSVYGTSNVSTVVVNTGVSYFDSSVIVNEGYYDTIVCHAGTQFLGTSVGESIYLLNIKQMYQSDITINPLFNYTKLESTRSAIKGDFNNCLIIGGTIHNSNITSCFVKPVTNTYFYNNTVSGTSSVDTAVKWDLIEFNGTADTIAYDGSEYYISTYSNYGSRKTAFKTGPATLLPLTSKVQEFNKLSGNSSIINYNSQTIVVGNIISTKELLYHVPSMDFISANYNAYVSIIDHGDMTYNIYFNWYSDSTKRRSDVLFSDLLSNDLTLQAAIEARSTYIGHAYIEGNEIDPNFTGVNPGYADVREIRNVPKPFRINNHEYYNNLRSRSQSDISINVYESPTVPAGQPDPAYGLALTPFLMILDIMAFTMYDNLMPGSTTPITDSAAFGIYFRSNGPMVAGPILATSVPACFIEVERVIIKRYDGANLVKGIVIHDCNYCPTTFGYTDDGLGLEYSWDTLVPGSAYPTSFSIQKPPYDGSIASWVLWSFGDEVKAVIDVEYWITWYYASNLSGPTLDNLQFAGYTGGGNREKRTNTYTFTKV